METMLVTMAGAFLSTLLRVATHWITVRSSTITTSDTSSAVVVNTSLKVDKVRTFEDKC